MNASTQHPKTAFRFLAPASIDPGLAAAERAVHGIAYSGEVITDHGYWNNLVIDLSSLSVETPIPLLSLHDHDETIGIVTGAANDGHELSIQGRLFADVDDEAAGIAAKADKGFPWQLSVGIWPSSIDQVLDGQPAELNGRQFTGPLTIFRGSRVREVSVCAVGADSRTSVTVLNAEFHPHPPTQGQTAMNELEQSKAKVAELEAELAALKAQHAALSASQPDPAKFAPVEAMQHLQAELAALQAKDLEREIADLVRPALADGRLMAVQEAWATSLGKANLAALKEFLDTAKPIAALQGTQTGGKAPEQGDPALPLADRLKPGWQGNAELRAEFGGDFDAYLAYSRANEANQIKLHGVQS
jgi:hypothetical protein